MISGINDVTGSQDIPVVPSWVDANTASISQSGDSLVFSMEVYGVLPSAMQPATAAEWGFMIDLAGSGSPDWIIYASDTVQDGWTAGIFNPKTKQRLAGAQMPGTVEHDGTKLTWTIKSQSLGAPQSFKWFAFTNIYVKPATGSGQQAGDKIPNKGAPENSADWLPYP